ncbi:MAG: hypothetical protein ACREOZ_00230, partial [Gloeomargaritales cyanobacterium]
MGKDFYIVFPHAAYGNQNVLALVNSKEKQKLKLTAPGSGATGFYPINLPDAITNISGIFHIESKSEIVDKKGAARIQSTYPVSIVGQFGEGGISGTYTALPVSAWGTEYYVLDEPEGTNSGYSSYYPGVYSVPQIT